MNMVTADSRGRMTIPGTAGNTYLVTTQGDSVVLRRAVSVVESDLPPDLWERLRAAQANPAASRPRPPRRDS